MPVEILLLQECYIISFGMYFLCTYILVLHLSIFITIIGVDDICMIVLNKVARPAHWVENLPKATKKQELPVSLSFLSFCELLLLTHRRRLWKGLIFEFAVQKVFRNPKIVLPLSGNSCPTNKVKGVLIGCLLVILP